MKKCLLISTGFAALIGLNGCATDSAAPQAQPAAATATAPAPAKSEKKEFTLIPIAKINAIAKGMKSEQVRELLGEPNAVTPFSKEGLSGEIWAYRIAETVRAEQVPTAMRDIPYWDPIQNKMVTIKEPVYQVQNTRTYRTLELLIVDGRLIERRPGVDQERTYY